MALKTPISISFYRLVFGKLCHLPMKFKYKAFWVFKKLNFDMWAIGNQHLLQLNELDEFYNVAYENIRIYKE